MSAAGDLSVGLVSGVLSGSFGIGGGLVTTPAIRLLLGRPALVAVGTPLAVVIPTALVAASGYIRRGLSDVGAGLTIGLGGAVTSAGGAFLATLAGGRAVRLVTAVLIVYSAWTMARRRAEGEEPAGPAAGVSAAGREVSADTTPQPRRPQAEAALGLAAGLLAGFLGLGGGFVIVPALVRLFRYPMKRAIGTSLLAVAVIAVPGAVAHWGLGNVDVRLALVLGAGGVAGAAIGARLAALARDRSLRLGFAFVLALSGVSLALSEAVKAS